MYIYIYTYILYMCVCIYDMYVRMYVCVHMYVYVYGKCTVIMWPAYSIGNMHDLTRTRLAHIVRQMRMT